MSIHRTLSSQAARFSCFALVAAVCIAMPACSVTKAGDTDKDPAAEPAIAGVVRVTRQSFSNALEIASEFVPYQEIDVHAKVSGYVQKLYVDWGSHVHQGQLLAVLDVPELNAQVMQDKASVQRDEQNVARAKEELVRDQSASDVAHLTYTRLFSVQKSQPGLVAQEEVDVAHGKDLEATAAVSADQAALAAAQEELEAGKSMVQRDEALFNYSRITAPFDGVVTQLDAYTGSLLPAGTSTTKASLALCHLAENDLLRLVIPVPERVVPNIHSGEVVKVRVPSLNKSFAGKVSHMADEIDLDTRTMHTEVDVPNPSSELVPGMYAYVDLPVQSVVDALGVPIQAVVRNGSGQGTVLVVNQDHQIEQRTVQLGTQTPYEVEVLSGLHDGDLVVFGEQASYRAGEKVKPKLIEVTQLAGGVR